jgi:predicted RNase H-like nuclease (RuvC/YqgF family)
MSNLKDKSEEYEVLLESRQSEIQFLAGTVHRLQARIQSLEQGIREIKTWCETQKEEALSAHPHQKDREIQSMLAAINAEHGILISKLSALIKR